MASVAILVVVTILGTNFHIRRTPLLQEFQIFVRGAAGTTALALSGEELKEIHSPNDAMSPAFTRAREILERSREINGLAENEMYVLRPTGASLFETEFVVMLQKKTFIGSRYSVPIGNRDRILTPGTPASPPAAIFTRTKMVAGSAATLRSSTARAGRWRSWKPTPGSVVISSVSAPSFCWGWPSAPARF